jgi:hypothetical protein
METTIKTIEHGEARRRLIAWISDERGCDNSCLAQLYSIIEPDPVAVTTDGTTGDAWEGGSPAVAKKTYTVRIEWPVTYYCDTTVEASSREEAERLAMEDPDYDNQRSYDDGGGNTVEGICEGDEFDRDNMI